METSLNYRSYLRDELANRKQKNAQYSLRSFAKHLGVQPSFLSLILSGKRDLSESMIAQFVERLGLTEDAARAFELRVRLEKATTSAQKARILEQLQNLDPKYLGQRDLGVDQFRMISEWYHFAILSLIEIKDFVWSVSAVAQTLKINSIEVEQALERMHALELIDYEKGSRPSKTEDRFVVSSSQHQEAVKKYHLQMIEKVRVAQTEQAPSERFTGTENIALSPNQLIEANQILEDCLQKLVALSKKKKMKAEVFHVETHLIRLTQSQTLKGNLKK